MEAKEMALNNAESLTEELSDEMLAACVGGTGFVNSQGHLLGHGATAEVDQLFRTPAVAGITYDPEGSTRATLR